MYYYILQVTINSFFKKVNDMFQQYICIKLIVSDTFYT